jgi:hypothetical protein
MTLLQPYLVRISSFENALLAWLSYLDLRVADYYEDAIGKWTRKEIYPAHRRSTWFTSPPRCFIRWQT